MSNEEEEAKARIKAEAEAKFAKTEEKFAEEARMFDPKQLAASNKGLKQKVHPFFGKVLYGIVTMSELDQIKADVATYGEKERTTVLTEMIVWKMLQKGCPELTLDDVRTGYSFEEVSELATLLSGDSFFLKRASSAGSGETAKHNGLV